MKVHHAYDQWASSYDADPNRTRDLDALVVKKVLGKLRPRTALELGCGTGKNTSFLARISDAVQALDFSKGMIAQAQKKVSSGHVSFGIADLSQRWPCRGVSIDLAVCNLVLEHIKDLRHIFAEAHRVLRFGGMFFVSELHPFRQYQGKQANFDRNKGSVRIPAFVRHVSDFVSAAEDFELIRLDEWWHKDDEGKPPRLVSFLFRKPFRPNKALLPTRAYGMKLLITRAAERKR